MPLVAHVLGPIYLIKGAQKRSLYIFYAPYTFAANADRIMRIINPHVLHIRDE